MFARCRHPGLSTSLLLVTENATESVTGTEENPMFVTQESVHAEIAYRLERADAAALRTEARAARKERKSRRESAPRTAVRRVTPALP